MQLILTPELLLEAYAQGLFPMSYSREISGVHWICPEMRGQLSIEGIHIPKRLKQTLRRAPYEIRIDSAFRDVIEGCAAPRENHPDTWINEQIIENFCALHDLGHAHSVECWDGAKLVGGVYGLKIGAAFFGESMFSKSRDASKIALIHLTARLWRGGFEIFDTQFVNEHLEQFGVYEIPHDEYIKRLTPALKKSANFTFKDLEQDQILKGYLEMRDA